MFLMIYQNSPKNILDMRSDKFDSQLDRKVKPGSLLSLMCMFPESNKTKFWSPIFHLQTSGTLQTRMDQCGRRHENEFWQFSNTKVNIREQLELKDKIKNGVSCLVSFFPSWVMVLKLPKIVHFCKLVLILARNLNLLMQFIYIHLKYFIMLFQKIVYFIEEWAIVHEIVRNKIPKKCWLSRNLTKFINFKH